MRFNIKYFEQVKSTNDTAKQLAVEGAESGTVVTAPRQISGRGRMGRNWFSHDGCYFSLILRPDVEMEVIPQLALIAGIAVCRGIIAITSVVCGVKWPNDILINKKKVCGILVESNSSMDFVILGIGVNVNTESFTDDLFDKATSIYIETGKKYAADIIMQQILEEFSKLYEIFLQEKNFHIFVSIYKKLCLNIGKSAIIKDSISTSEIICLCTDISNNGELVVLTNTGETRILNSGEVSVRGLNGYI